MARINLEELRKEEEMRKKKYVWEKPLIICGRVIKSMFKDNNQEKKE